MRKNLRVIQINGFRGLLVSLFVISCLIAGFVAFPAFLTMYVWNYLALKTGSFPTLAFGEGLLLWAIIAFSIYIFNKRKFIVSFRAQQELSDEEVKEVISKIKSKTIEPCQNMTKKITTITENNEELEEVHSDSNNI